MTVLVEIPPEDLLPGQQIHVSTRTGIREVREIENYSTLGLEEVDCFVVLYRPASPDRSWENRSGMKGVVTARSRGRDELVGMRPLRRGELVQIERLHLVNEGS